MARVPRARAHRTASRAAISKLQKLAYTTPLRSWLRSEPRASASGLRGVVRELPPVGTSRGATRGGTPEEILVAGAPGIGRGGSFRTGARTKLQKLAYTIPLRSWLR